jgi:FkbM family methyltransferase
MQAARKLVPRPLRTLRRRRRVSRRIASFDERTVVHSYGPHTLSVHLADPMAEGWYDHDWDDLSTLAFLRERGVLRPGARVFDLGAHQGVVALMLAREVGESGLVVAVEAEAHNARLLERNVEINDAGNVRAMHAAGGAQSGFVFFEDGLNGHVERRGGIGRVRVPTVTVDGLAEEWGPPDLVMIDVEGFEGPVLEGATRTLGNGSTSFFVEVHETAHKYGAGAEQIVAAFAGFDVHATLSEEEPVTPLAGAPPAGRFFLLALAANRA